MLELRGVTFFGQDWGGLIGLRVVAESPDRFARVLISNTGLPTGETQVSEAFLNWKRIHQGMIDRHSDRHDAGAEQRRPLAAGSIRCALPGSPLQGGSAHHAAARSGRDPVTGGLAERFPREVPRAKGQEHRIVAGAGHFIQESHGEERARIIVDFMAANSP